MIHKCVIYGRYIPLIPGNFHEKPCQLPIMSDKDL